MRRARGPWRASGRPELAECSEAFRSQPESAGAFPGHCQQDRPQTEFWDPASPRSGNPGEGANFSSFLVPRGPLAPTWGRARAAAAGTQDPASHDKGGRSSLPVAALGLGGPRSAPWRGAGEGRPPPVAPAIRRGRGLSSAWGSAGRGKGTT